MFNMTATLKTNQDLKIQPLGDPGFYYQKAVFNFNPGFIASFHGTSGPDTFRGNYFTDEMWGYDGNDVLEGMGGHDKLYGGSQNDVLYGGANNDKLHGGGQNDVLYGGADNDKLYGGNQNDVLYGGADNDALYGGAQNDVLYGGAYNDALFGGEGDDTLFGGHGVDTLDGGAGIDTVSYADSARGMRIDLEYGEADGWEFIDRLLNVEHAIGSNFGDTIDGRHYQANTLDGGGGYDRIRGHSEKDLIIGGFGADYMRGHDDNDTFRFFTNHSYNGVVDVIEDFDQRGDDLLSFDVGNPGAAYWQANLEVHNGQVGTMVKVFDVSVGGPFEAYRVFLQGTQEFEVDVLDFDFF